MSYSIMTTDPQIVTNYSKCNSCITAAVCAVHQVTFETGRPLSARDVADDVAHGEQAIESNRRAMVVCTCVNVGAKQDQDLVIRWEFVHR